MKKFKCTVTRTDEYIIEFDETVINEQFMDEFRHVFYPFHTLEEHAEHIAQVRARFGEGSIEGYGNSKVDGKIPWWVTKSQKENRHPSEDAINIKIISEDRDCEVQVIEFE